ncbi:hypothetical protein SAMN04488076_10818 [Trichococcus palustris]|nr:hypothetical protein SAMN04488076_10818 [Trichococcus palustris]
MESSLARRKHCCVCETTHFIRIYDCEEGYTKPKVGTTNGAREKQEASRSYSLFGNGC